MAALPPGVKFHNFVNAGPLQPGDEIVGVRNLVNSRFDAPVAGSATAFTRNIVQGAHGLLLGNIVRLNGANYVTAQANNSVNANVVGIVSAVVDVNEFTLLFGGFLNTLALLVAGSVYFLDPVTAGAMTTVAPVAAGQIRKPLFISDTTTSGYWINYNGQQL